MRYKTKLSPPIYNRESVMPKIRSITYFTNVQPAHADSTFQHAGAFLRHAEQSLTSILPVQSMRLATQPFPHYGIPANEIPPLAKQLYAFCQREGIHYLSLGKVGINDDVDYLNVIEQVLSEVQGVFATAVIADKAYGIDLPRLLEVGRLVQRLSSITPDGMTNRYFAALGNCPAGSPFFPVAYHDGGDPYFALAIQAADVAVEAFRDAATPTVARQRLTDAIQTVTDAIVPTAERLAQESGIPFTGLDFSLAPYPLHTESLGGALEALGGRFGGAGLVASASIVMNAIEAANFPRACFCGLMLPILEDSVLATRNTEGALTLNDLLLLSAVCGTGLDCIPLPGAINEGELRDILLDVAALALRLDKPLTARLMPFPDKIAGDKLSFGFEFFAESEVMPAPQRATSTTFQSNDRFTITPRNSRR
jgi:uncharacterized protein